LLLSILHFLSSPLISGIFLGLIAGIAFKLKWELFSEVTWILTGLWMFVSIFSPLPSYLLQKLERTPKENVVAKESYLMREIQILVFASGFTNDTSLYANSQLSETMLQRVVEGVRLYHDIGAKQLILGGPCKDEGGCQAEAAAEVASSLKVPSESIALITAGHNTIKELEAYTAEYGKEGNLIAVSSALSA
jgi:hypothetical protein